MASNAKTNYDKPHAVCIPLPLQSHISAMLSVAKLLHQRGFHITFVNTENNHKRIIKSRGPNSLDGLPNFDFRTIPDGVSTTNSSNIDSPQDFNAMCAFISKDFLRYFCCLLSQLRDDASCPIVSCIISDGVLSLSTQAAEEFNIPIALFWPISACSFLGFMRFRELKERGIVPLKDESCLRNGYLETTIDWVHGMKNIRLKDLPSFIRTTNPNDILLNFLIRQVEKTKKASAIILNTFDALDQEILDALSCLLPPIYTIGPLHLFSKEIKDERLEAMGTNFLAEEPECINWLNSKEINSVVYINFGSLAIMTPHHLTEFAWGLANSGKAFLWIIRPDLLNDDSTFLPFDFFEETKERGMMGSWCCQEEVLRHPSIRGFVTHSGWNSTIESISAGVPMISCPSFGDQQTTCWYSCVKWGIALEIDCDVKRDEVESCIRELMEGKKGEDMKRKVMELKSKAEESLKLGGSSRHNFEKLIVEILLSQRYHDVRGADVLR